MISRIFRIVKTFFLEGLDEMEYYYGYKGGEKIKKLRKEAGMTQVELASKLGLKGSVIAKYENGRIPDLKRTTIAGLAKVFNVSPMDTVLLMIYTGVRIGELLSIEKEDVHLQERYITIRGTKTANAMRYVPIHEDLVDIVGKMLTKSNKWLVETNIGKKMTYRQYHQFLTCMNKTFGMKHEPHECRYSFATYSAECDMDSRIRKFIMGHSQGNITDDVYTDISKLIPKMVREIRKFDPMKGLLRICYLNKDSQQVLRAFVKIRKGQNR